MNDLIEAHLLHLKAAGCSPYTLRLRRWLLNTADQAFARGVETASSTEWERFLARDGWSPATRYTYHKQGRRFYEWATAGDDPYLDYNPFDEIRRPRLPDSVPNPVTDAQFAEAMDRSNERWQRIICLGAYGGLRAGEICRLDRRHITADRIRIVSGKGGRTAEVPTHPEVWARVEHLPPGLVATASVRTQLSTRAREHFDRIGMHDVHLHRFRHWFACALLRGGTDIRKVQQLMRHGSLETTAGYLLVVDEDLEEAIARLPEPGRRAAPTTRPTAARPSSSQPDTQQSTHRHAA